MYIFNNYTDQLEGARESAYLRQVRNFNRFGAIRFNAQSLRGHIMTVDRPLFEKISKRSCLDCHACQF